MMLLTVVVLISYICTISPVTGNETSATAPRELEADDVAARIIGGEITNIKNYPFIVSVQRRHSSKHTCGGTYVAPRFILSAAHCMVRPLIDDTWIAMNPRLFYVIAGTTYAYLSSWSAMQMELIDMTLPHAEFRFSHLRNDIGLFRLTRPLYRNSYVQYATLPTGFIADMFQRYTGYCVAVGWGQHTIGSKKGIGTYLRHIWIPIIPPRQCPLQNVHENEQLCAGLKEGGACKGDSGGPLLCKGIQIGIVSWGTDTCLRPGVFCRVDFYLQWLNTTILRNEASKYSYQYAITIISTLYCVYFYQYNNL